MEKKEIHKKDSFDKLPEVSPRPSMAHWLARTLSVIKFILGLCLLAFVYSVSVAFLNEFYGVEHIAQVYFWSGAISFLAVYLFILEPTIIYAKGQKILEAVFKFFAPLVRVAPYVLPIYSIILSLLYLLLSLMISSKNLLYWFMFLLGFTMVLHLVFGAKTLRSKQGDFLKANYIFGFSLVYIINVFLAGFFLNLIFKEFSFVNFSNNTYQIAKDIFAAVFKQLFVPS